MRCPGLVRLTVNSLGRTQLSLWSKCSPEHIRGAIIPKCFQRTANDKIQTKRTCRTLYKKKKKKEKQWFRWVIHRNHNTPEMFWPFTCGWTALRRPHNDHYIMTLGQVSVEKNRAQLPVSLPPSYFHKWIYYFQALTCPPRQDGYALTQPTNYCQPWPWRVFLQIAEPVTQR